MGEMKDGKWTPKAYPSTFNGHPLVPAETAEPMNAHDYFQSAWFVGQLVRIEFPSRWEELAPEYRKLATITGRIITVKGRSTRVGSTPQFLRRFEVTIDGFNNPITVYEESERGEATIEAMLTPLAD